MGLVAGSVLWLSEKGPDWPQGASPRHSHPGRAAIAIAAPSGEQSSRNDVAQPARPGPVSPYRAPVCIDGRLFLLTLLLTPSPKKPVRLAGKVQTPCGTISRGTGVQFKPLANLSCAFGSSLPGGGGGPVAGVTLQLQEMTSFGVEKVSEKQRDQIQLCHELLGWV